jgi:hypothetical protein
MTLPFTPEQFFDVMARYNGDVWPAQLALHAVAVACVALLAVRGALASRLICAALALLWAWGGIAYHFMYFSDVNPAAGLFGALFLGAAGAFAWEGVVRARLHFTLAENGRSALGFVLLAYALLVYPLLALVFGHVYPRMPTFGLPCPTTIFTLGMLAFLRPPFPRQVLVPPLVWIAIGSQAALLFGVYEDLGLLAAGVAGLWFAFEPFRQARHT